jgi:hypothetical protein
MPKILMLIMVIAVLSSPSYATLDLTGEWSLTGEDNLISWGENLYIIQAPEPIESHYPLSGSFYWYGTSHIYPEDHMWGWEDFEDGINGTQSYFDVDTMRVHIEGYQIRDSGSTTLGYLALSVYDADVAPDGQHLINGVWIGGMSGTWEAELIPEPATVILVGLGGLIVLRKRK